MTKNYPREHNIVCNFKYWTLLLHMNQCSPGRSIIQLKREGRISAISHLRSEERTELFSKILPAYERAIHASFYPSGFNYPWLVAEISTNGHTLWHLIPWYSNTSFEDSERVLQRDAYTPPEETIRIREAIAHHL